MKFGVIVGGNLFVERISPATRLHGGAANGTQIRKHSCSHVIPDQQQERIRYRLERLGKPRLLQYSIGRMARQDFIIDGETPMCEGAIPNIVIALPASFKTATGLFEKGFDFRGKGLWGH